MLGKAERPGSLAEYFVPLERQPNIYERKDVVRTGFELPAHVAPFPVFKHEESPAMPESKTQEGGPLNPLQRRVDRLLLAQYAPPALVIDDTCRIIEFRGDVGGYLAPAAGEAELDLFRMLPDDVALHLRAAVEESRQKNMGIRLESIQVLRGSPKTITLAVTPILASGLGRYFLISFEEASPARSHATGAAGTRRRGRKSRPIRSTGLPNWKPN